MAFHRLAAAGIILFWLVMTGLLVRSQWLPHSGGQMAVPPAHVFKEIFLHEQASDLALYRSRQRLGTFHLQPRRDPVTKTPGVTHSVVITGGSSLDFFGLPSQRVILHGVFELNAAHAVCRFEVAATIRELRQKEPSLGVTVDGAPGEGRYHYLIRSGETVQKEGTGTVEELLGDSLWQSFGFDPRPLLHQALAPPATAAAAAQLEATRATIPYNGEVIDTYLVTVRGAGLEATLQTTQQGQILAITTGAGYNFYDEALAP